MSSMYSEFQLLPLLLIVVSITNILHGTVKRIFLIIGIYLICTESCCDICLSREKKTSGGIWFYSERFLKIIQPSEIEILGSLFHTCYTPLLSESADVSTSHRKGDVSAHQRQRFFLVLVDSSLFRITILWRVIYDILSTRACLKSTSASPAVGNYETMHICIMEFTLQCEQTSILLFL